MWQLLGATGLKRLSSKIRRSWSLCDAWQQPPASVTHAIWVRIRSAKCLARLLKEIPHMTVIASEAAGAEIPREYPRRAAVIGWIFFDWAAQPYFTLITTFVFAPYFASHVASDPAQGQALWGFATAAAGMVIALL